MRNIFFPKMEKGTFYSPTSGGRSLEEYLPLLAYDYRIVIHLMTAALFTAHLQVLTTYMCLCRTCREHCRQPRHS